MFASSADSGANQGVPTKTILKLKDEVDVKECIISMNDLSKVKEQDSFLYYSIPEVHHAKMLEEDLDMAQVDDAQPRSVTRRSCISFECCPDRLLFDEEDDLLGGDPEDGSDDSDDPLDILVGRLLCL